MSLDVAIVGAGIMGLAHAWAAAKRGYKVAVFERSPYAQMASIRNFGMIWPIGQRAGEDYDRAMRSRALWVELQERVGFWMKSCGSLHLAYQQDELAVIQEFVEETRTNNITCEYWNSTKTCSQYPAIVSDQLLGALYSPIELCVDPREVVQLIPKFLREQYDVQFHFGTTIVNIDMPKVLTSHGECIEAERIMICSGADFETLFPSAYQQSGLRRCKLQMLATDIQPADWQLGTHVAGGLTLLHYQSFQSCQSLAALKNRIQDTMPEYIKYGIHVMASQNGNREIIIGDSHEYDHHIQPFDSDRIDQLILDYLHGMINIPSAKIVRRWHGIYAKHPTSLQFTAEVAPNCFIQSSPGGAGMTLSFAFAEDWWQA